MHLFMKKCQFQSRFRGGAFRGCIVELYQFRCTDESLPLRVFSGQKPVYMLRGGDQEVSVENIRTDSGQNRCSDGGAAGGYQAAFR